MRVIGLLALCTTFVVANQGGFPDCVSGPLSSFSICNQTLTFSERASDLVTRLTLDEKIQMLGTTSSMAPRLGIPSYQWWSEALHGIASSPGVTFSNSPDLPLNSATSFPQVIGVAAAFDMKLVSEIAEAISTEARAFSNSKQAGLGFFTPNINIFRDPRWGRGQETPGEDPYLTSQYVYHLVRGLQVGSDPRYQKVAPCCKHFAAYDLENWNGTDRFHFNAIVSDRDLVETYQPPFESCVRDANVASIMCSYNAVNGIPSCANNEFLQTVLRDQWGFDGFVVSDCGAIDVIYTAHQYAPTVEQTIADAFGAGVSLDCEGSFYQSHTGSALSSGAVLESTLDALIVRNVLSLLKLGFFDPPLQQPYRQIGPSSVNTKEHQELALRAARESIVLLQNKGSLPLAPTKITRIAVIGPSANATATLQGNYYGVAPFLITVLAGINSYAESSGFTVSYAKGCNINDGDTSGFDAAQKAVEGADAVVFVGGIDQSIEAEGLDRYSLSLPGQQWPLYRTLLVSLPSSTPFIFVILSGGGIDVTEAKEGNSTIGMRQADAVVWTGYPGQSGGQAVADVLFGQYNPAGRLPITWYPAAYVDQVSMFDMNMRAGPNNPGRTYKFYTGTPVFSFGFGLSYTSFTYSWLSDDNNDNNVKRLNTNLLRKHALASSSAIVVSYRVVVTNVGSVSGSDSVLLFLSASSSPGMLRVSADDGDDDDVGQLPSAQLIGVQRTTQDIQPGEKTTLVFQVTAQQMTTVRKDGSRVFLGGTYDVYFGVDKKLKTQIQVTGKTRLLKS